MANVAELGSILTINGGSSSIKYALFSNDDPPRRTLSGQIERLDVSDHRQAVDEVIAKLKNPKLTAIGHRIVHGGIHLLEHQLIDDAVLNELRQAQSLDIAHLPREIALIETFREKFPNLPQVACFDTAFGRDLPRVAQLLPIPRRFNQQGVRRFGFHGLSYTYLMNELHRIAPQEVKGKIILAHLGSGASMAAVHDGKPIDATMCFTPTAGLVMGTRPGDIDPGLLIYLMENQKLSPRQMDDFINQQCGLLGVSETTSDMRDLLARRSTDVRAAEAVELFCYQARKWIGAFTAAMNGLETLIFAGGIGEHSSPTRGEICKGLEFLGLKIDPDKNNSNNAVISSPQSRVVVRVIPTNEEIVIAQATARLIQSRK